MKKVSLLLGSLGGALAGYVFSNKKLRQDLANAKDAQAAAKVLGKHLSADGQAVGKEVKQFVHSDQFQEKMSEAKKYAKQYYEKSKKEVTKLMKQGKKEATGFIKNQVGGMKKGKK
jgi:tRNA G18 (ribose-2'-O)-methylase SpoU